MLNLNTLKNIYDNSPLWIKGIYGKLPNKYKFGKYYIKYNDLLKENSIDEETYQLLKIRETIEIASKSVPFYKKLGVKINDINALKDVSELPLITKELIKENFNDFVNQDYPKRKTFYVTTGGSSGEPMKFIQSSNVWKKELAFLHDFYEGFNLKSNIIKASFRGGEFTETDKNIFWKYNPIHNELHFSPFHLNNKSVQYYVNVLNKFKIQAFHGYPSSILNLIEFMRERNLKLNYSPKVIFLISENFTLGEIKKMKAFFKCDVTSFYGHSERLIFAALDKQNDSFSYNVKRKYGYMELQNSNNNVIVENNIIGELVGTSFDNYAMPLIRYCTNDYTQYDDFNNKIIGEIKGRWDKEYFVGKSGEKITTTALNMHSDIFSNVSSFQFCQKKKGELQIYVVPNKLFTREDELKIIEAFNNKTQNILETIVFRIETPILTPRGKMPKIIKRNIINN